jgi:lipoprotein-anchoring transpeptidase ErfK/SrfK
MGIRTTAAAVTVLVVLASHSLLAQAQYSRPDSWQNALRPPLPIGSDTGVTGSIDPKSNGQSLPAEIRPEGRGEDLPAQFRRQLVEYRTSEPTGTIVIDTSNTYLYLVLGGDKAMRYGIGVGREGFTWAGIERISRMAAWPDWHPPTEMIDREPHLPRFMAGGEGNPLGARALYLGKTVYRIHGTNQPSTIGTFVSSGCIRLTNDDISDLYARVQVGARVVVLRGQPSASPAPTPQRDSRGENRLVPPTEVPAAPAHLATHR